MWCTQTFFFIWAQLSARTIPQNEGTYFDEMLRATVEQILSNAAGVVVSFELSVPYSNDFIYVKRRSAVLILAINLLTIIG